MITFKVPDYFDLAKVDTARLVTLFEDKNDPYAVYDMLHEISLEIFEMNNMTAENTSNEQVIGLISAIMIEAYQRELAKYKKSLNEASWMVENRRYQ